MVWLNETVLRKEVQAVQCEYFYLENFLFSENAMRYCNFLPSFF